MGRLFSVVLLYALLLPVPARQHQAAQPVFFSMLFPQLIPDFLWKDVRLEEVAL